MQNRATRLLILGVVMLAAGPMALASEGLRIAVSFPSSQSRAALDGRMLLMISKDGSGEPRFQINDGPNTQQLFGIDVNALGPEAPASNASRVTRSRRSTSCGGPPTGTVVAESA